VEQSGASVLEGFGHPFIHCHILFPSTLREKLQPIQSAIRHPAITFWLIRNATVIVAALFAFRPANYIPKTHLNISPSLTPSSGCSNSSTSYLASS
jgi:hypothetical protein